MRTTSDKSAPVALQFAGYVKHVQVEIELRQMRYFLAVAEERNFTRAAMRCHVAQPSLSKQIHEIENCLGAKLFERLPRDVRLTEAGRIFQKEAELAVEHSRRASSQVRAFKQQGQRPIRIGLSNLCDLPHVQCLVATAQKSVVANSTDVISGHSRELRVALLRGELDLAVIDLPVKADGVSVVPLYPEALIAWLPEKHPLTVRPMVRFFDVKREHFVLLSERVDPGSSVVQTAMEQAGIEAGAIHAASSLIELFDQVALSKCIGLTRRSAGRLRREGIISKPLHHPIQLETSLAWRSDNRSPSMVSFRDALIAFSQRGRTRRSA
jgi:LysR family transcriptional regulator, hca operon transcriptional activator